MKKLIIVILVVLFLYCFRMYFSYFSLFATPEIRTITTLNTDLISEIQSEFGFELPLGANIVLCKYSNSRDRLFTVNICDVPDVFEFVNNNLKFEVEEPYEIEHYAYDTTIIAEYYFGFYGGSKRGVYVYSIDSEIIIEIEKSGIVTKKLLEMFF